MSAPRRLSTTARVATAFALVLAIGVTVSAALAYIGIRTTLAAQIDDVLLDELQGFSAAVYDDEGDMDTAVRDYLAFRPTGTAAPIVLVSFPGGRVLSNSDIRIEEAPDVAALLDPDSGATGLSTVEVEGEEYRVATSPIEDASGEVVGVFQAALPLAQVAETAGSTGLTLLLAGLGVIALGTAASAMVARAALSPLADAADRTRAIGQTTLSERLPYDGTDDEVGVLVEAVNGMLDRLETAFGEQRRFTHDASHELRTPLAVIRGHLELAEEERLDSAEREASIAIVVEEVGRMERLVEDLLALARLEAGPPKNRQPLDIALVAQEAADRARTLGPQSVATTCGRSGWVEGDPDQLLQVLLNLLANAVAHTPPDTRIEIGCAPDEQTVRIVVTDSGPGIPEEDLPRIFDRFFRSAAGRSGGGSGLGLAIAQRLAELHGGCIVAANVPDGGARFVVELPRIEAPKLPEG